jgi:hypothetical protein
MTMRQVTNSMANVVRGIDHAVNTMNLEQASLLCKSWYQARMLTTDDGRFL